MSTSVVTGEADAMGMAFGGDVAAPVRPGAARRRDDESQTSDFWDFAV